MKHRYISLTLLAALNTFDTVVAQVTQISPKLVVNITIDQLRSDYLDAFTPLYEDNGFKKLLSNGLVYTNASYPFSPIDRASAIAAITTGTTPYYNGIVGRQWLDKESLRPVFCTDDNKYKGIQTINNSSPKNISTSTLGDEMKVSTNGKSIVFSISPYRDASVISAGHAADGAFWLDDNNGNWCSSTYYFKQLPSWATAINELNHSSSSVESKEWIPSNQLIGNYSYFMSGGIQKPFKHTFKGPRRYREFNSSGLVNESISKMAIYCVESNAMGLDNFTDLLNITYYAGNFDHKAVNDNQLELQDTYVRLDKEISALVKKIENRVGKDNVLFIVTSTGCSDEEDAEYSRYRIPTGTFYINRTSNLLNMYFGAIWGQDRYVESCFGQQIFLNHKTLEQKHVSFANATERAQEFLSQMSGVRNVYTSQQLLTGGNPEIKKIRNGFFQERVGDILIEIAPGWRLLNEDNLDNQLYRASFIQFPIIFYGAGTKPERIATPVTIDRIAPTVSKAIRIRAPNACSSEPLF